MVPVRPQAWQVSASRAVIEGSRLDWFFLSFLFVFTFPCLFCSEGVSDTDMSRVWLVLFMGRGFDTVVLFMGHGIDVVCTGLFLFLLLSV